MTVQTRVSTTDVTLRLVGESGEGTISLGELTAKMLVALGLNICSFQTFPAEVRGGTVMFQIRACSEPALTEGDAPDVLVALTKEGFDLFGKELRERGHLLYDADVFTPEFEPGRMEYGLPISTLARAAKEAVKQEADAEALTRLPLPKNIVSLGALMCLLDAPLEPAEQYLHDLFDRKGEAIVRMNIRALHAGAEQIAVQIAGKSTPRIVPRERAGEVITVNGNQMLAMGALAGGMHFFAGYPITPATEIMEFLARELPKFSGDLIQAEDEIAALGMCIGAGFAGKKAMTSTSGPGLSLMVEQINLAGQAEVPVVIVDVQRGGASTGMPTKTSQGDLNLALYGVHNESPHIVLAAASVEDCFWSAIEAFNLAETYQCPVILLSDQSLATRKVTLPLPDLDRVSTRDRLVPSEEALAAGYQRYADTETGVSPMSLPGMPGGAYVATGIEHDECGSPGYTPELARQMKEKRFRKLETLRRSHSPELANIHGDPSLVDVGIIAFGSTEGVIQEAVERARSEGYGVAHLHLRLLNPLPIDQIETFAERCQEILVPELNYSGQLAGWLRVHSRILFDTLHKDEGVPFRSDEIYSQITALARR